jgi:hypothetical protein
VTCLHVVRNQLVGSSYLDIEDSLYKSKTLFLY